VKIPYRNATYRKLRKIIHNGPHRTCRTASNFPFIKKHCVKIPQRKVRRSRCGSPQANRTCFCLFAWHCVADFWKLVLRCVAIKYIAVRYVAFRCVADFSKVVLRLALRLGAVRCGTVRCVTFLWKSRFRRLSRRP